MEAVLQKGPFAISEPIRQRTAEVTVEGDAIVPDTKADILKLLEADGYAYLDNSEVRGDKLFVGGMMHIRILYIPDTGGAGDIPAECMEMRIPFKDVMSIGTEDAEITAEAELAAITPMLINSRKLSVKGNVQLFIRGAKTTEAWLSDGLSAETEVECRTEKVRLSRAAAEGVYIFTAADAPEVPRDMPPVAEILRTTAIVRCDDIKLITGKMILKGGVRTRTLYRTPLPEEPLGVMEHEIPFTEILDMRGAEEGMEKSVDISVQKIYWEKDDAAEAVRTFGIEVTLRAAVSVWENTEVTLLRDCFCPGFKTEIEREKISMTVPRDTLEEEISVKKTLSLPVGAPPVSMILDVTAKPEIRAVSVENGIMEVSGDTAVSVLYRTENGDEALYIHDDRVPFSLRTETAAPPDADIRLFVRLSGLSFSIPDAGSMDVRVNLEIGAVLSATEEVENIKSVTLTEAEEAHKASVVIAFITEETPLWELARRYGVAPGKIAEQNDLGESEMIPAGSRILIP